MSVDIKVNGENRYGVNNLYAEKISGGNQKFELPKVLQNKSVTITQNETVTYTADSGYDGLESLEVTTNVSGGGGNPEGFYKTREYEPNTVSIVPCIKFSPASGYLDFSGIDTSGITDMSEMFVGCDFTQLYNSQNLITSNVTNTTAMFTSCWALTVLDARNFDTSNVVSMEDMFSDCGALNQLSIYSSTTKFDTSNVTNMAHMFRSCSSLTSLNLRNFNTSNVTTMSDMFGDCSSLTSLDIRNFDFTNVTDYDYMFQNVPSTCTISVNQAGYNFIANNFNNDGNTMQLASLSMLRRV